MTAPTINSGHVTKADTSATTSRTINAPTHVAGDYIFLAIANDDNSGTINTPTDFTPIYDNVIIKTATNSTVGRGSLYYKVATSSEPSTYTVTITASELLGMIAFAVNNAGAIHYTATALQGNDASAEVPGVVTSVDNCLRISVVWCDGATQTTPHGTVTNHTKLAEAWFTSAGAVSIHHRTVATAGNDGNDTESSTLAAPFRWASGSIAISPAAPSHSLDAGPISTGIPTIQSVALNQTHVLSAAALSSDTPTIQSVALGQTHALQSGPIISGEPMVAITALLQQHVLSVEGITTSSPSLSVATVSQTHHLTADGITIAAPTITFILFFEVPKERTIVIEAEQRIVYIYKDVRILAVDS